MPILNIGQTSDYVPPEGTLDRKIVIIGEAPGAYEVREKRPFVPNAPAGGILAQCMQHSGIIRRECYITNVFKRPVRKSSGKWYIDNDLVYDKGRFTIAGNEWLTLLRDELQNSSATVYIPMGEAATLALVGISKISKVRGSVLPSVLWDKPRKCIPCYHPAYAIDRKATTEEEGGAYIRRYFIIYDLRKAKKESASPDIVYPAPNIKIQPTYQETIDKLTWMKHNLKRVTVDIEVYNQEVSCLGIGTKDDVLVVPFTMGARDYWLLEEEAQVWLKIADIIEDENIEKVFQNGMFDLWVLMRNNNIIPKGQFHDTMVGWKICYPDDGFKKSLDVITSIYTDWPYYKDELKIWTTSHLTRDIKGDMTKLWTYNAKDVAGTAEALDGLLLELEKQDNMATYMRTMALYPALLYMEIRGIHADRGLLRAVKDEISERINVLQERLNELAGEPINPNSPTQLRNYFYIKLGIKPYTNYKTGSISVDVNALKRMCKATSTRPAIEEAKIIMEIRSLRKLKGTYLDIEFDADSRLRCSINPVGTKNGRISTSQTLFGTGTNNQNLPQQFKKFLLADDGNALVELDKTQGEWVIVGFLSGDGNMMNIIGSGEDAHIATGHMAFGVPKDLIKAESKAAGNETDPIKLRAIRKENVPEILKYNIPSSLTVRQAGKKSNHGLNYDMGYTTFAIQNEVPESDAKTIINAYHEAYPSIRVWHKWIRDELSKSRTLTNIFGRKRTFYANWGKPMFKDGYAFTPQSSLVDLLNRGIILIYDDKSRYMKPTDYLMQVHDSLLYQWYLADGRFNRLARAVWKQREHLEPTLTWQNRQFIVKTDMKMGLNWAGYHPDTNPTGMIEVKIDPYLDAFADRLAATYRMLQQNNSNL